MFNRACITRTWGALAVSTALASTASAQATLIGHVRDTSGVPVGLAQISSSGVRTLSDSGGRYLLSGLPSGKVAVNVRRLGYEPRDTSVELVRGRMDTLFVVLMILPRELPGVNAEAYAFSHARLADFYRHRQSGIGHFYDRQEIEERRATRISDILRRLPGIRITPDRSGRSVMRMGRTTGGRDCPPDYWIDGVRAAFLNVDDIPLHDVEALEIYKGPSGLPPEFNSRFGNPACGAVIIWTRLPG
jgi:hypothetical protein